MTFIYVSLILSPAGASGVGDQGRVRVLSEGERIATLQRDSIPSADQPNTELCKRVGKDRLNFCWFNYQRHP